MADIYQHANHSLQLRQGTIALLVCIASLLLAQHTCADTLTLYVERERMHTAMVLPVDALLKKAPAMRTLLDADDNTSWLRFGWGEAGYFGRDDRTSGTTLVALFWRSPSVMEVASLDSPRSSYSESYPLEVSTEQFAKIAQFISTTFPELDDSLSPQRKATPSIRYYDAKPRYHLFYNCNHWTAEALHNAGIIRGYRRAWLARSATRRLPQP